MTMRHRRAVHGAVADAVQGLGDSEVRSLRDTLNAGYLYLEVKCLGCDTHQTVALDIVRRRKTTPIHELERYMCCREGKNRKWAVATQTGS